MGDRGVGGAGAGELQPGADVGQEDVYVHVGVGRAERTEEAYGVGEEALHTLGVASEGVGEARAQLGKAEEEQALRIGLRLPRGPPTSHGRPGIGHR